MSNYPLKDKGYASFTKRCLNRGVYFFDCIPRNFDRGFNFQPQIPLLKADSFISISLFVFSYASRSVFKNSGKLFKLLQLLYFTVKLQKLQGKVGAYPVSLNLTCNIIQLLY